MAEKKVQRGVAYTSFGEKKISGEASTTPAPRSPKSLQPTDMASSLKPAQRTNLPRTKFEDQKRVNSVYRWK